MNEIYCIKLITGEEIITTVKEQTEQDILISDPAVLIINQEGMSLISWLMLSENEPIKISKQHILVMSRPKQKILNGYNSQFGSGIVTANSNDLNILNGLRGNSE
jgi:hypothetical protein